MAVVASISPDKRVIVKASCNLLLQVSFDVKEVESQEHSKSNEDSHDVSEMSDCTIKEEGAAGKPERENEGGDSLNSLASSRVSINSNDTLSGNTSIPSTLSNIHSSQAEDLLFGPRLHRTGSVHDVPLPPLRNKKRQYSSHEVLPSLEKFSSFRTLKSANGKTPLVRLNKTAISRLTEKENKDKLHEENNQPFNENDISKDQAKSSTATANVSKPHVSYEPFNKRAVIVASVTDRLYSTSKRKEDNVHPNSTPVGINKKPLNELKICSNARKKLFDISYKALRASRRIRPGVPVETQTDIKTSIRVKEVAIDIQDDIEPFRAFPSSEDKLYRHVSVETEAFTLLCKEASVGTTSGSLHSADKSVETDKFKSNHANFTFTRTCGNMTEEIRSLNAASTQTQEFAPPRKKYSSFTKYLKVSRDSPAPLNLNDRSTSPRVLNISISHDCSQFENETDGISDDSLENESHKTNLRSLSTRTTPDLLNNHNSGENGASGDGIFPQTIVSNNSVESPLRIPYASFSGNLDAKDIIKSGNSVSGKCTQTRNEITTAGREPPKVTNYDNIIKSKTPANINQTCDRVTTAKEEVVKLVGVTSRTATPPNSAPILTADSTRANKGVGTDDSSRESGCVYESKSTQANSVSENFNADFLENIYVPLPRICVSTNFNSDRWINMRDIIMGRDQNSYPYNIKVSPKRSGESGLRKKSKTVSWKIDMDSTEPTNARSNSPEINLSTFSKYNDAFETCGHESIRRSPRYTMDRDSLSPERTNSFVSEKPSAKNNFMGIRCWEDRIQVPSAKTETDINKHLKNRYTPEHDTKCLQYMEATSNLIKEATNLVASLSQVKDRFTDSHSSNTIPAKSISPICNATLQIVDEKANNNANSQAHYSMASTSPHRPQFKANTMCYSRMINDELINNEKQIKSNKDSPKIPDDLDLDEAVFSSDDELASAGKEIDSIEKALFDSLDRLEDCTEKTSGYFSSVSARYSDTFNRQLASLPPSGQTGPTPYPRTKRNPSKYLEELRKLRKELVASTKKDDYICRQFQMN